MKKISFGVLLFLCVTQLCAQDAKKYLKEGNNHLEYEHYRKAANAYRLVIKDEPENFLALFNLGRAYLGSYRHQEALELMEKAISINPKIDKHQDYWLGRAYHLNYKFEEAKKYYEAYSATISKTDPRKKDLDKFVLECGYAVQLMEKPSSYRIDNIGAPINTKDDEHSPIITQDGQLMMFTARKYTEEGESEDGNFSEQVFWSKKGGDGKWSKPVLFEHNLDGHDATVQLYDNDTKLMLYRNTGAGDLYVSENKNGKWSLPTPISAVNTPWPEVDAYVSTDGKTMIYSSSFKAANHDNTDLFVIKKDANGNWGIPKSLGSNINTDFDESSPYISSDGKVLFFSSKGHNSMGGFDVFKSLYDAKNDSWSAPINLGYPLNTPGDDIYFYYSNEDNWSGYFSSYRRDGLGEKDIYKVVFIPNVYIRGKVLDAKTNNVIDGVKVSFYAVGDDVEMASSSTEKSSGNYLVNVLADKQYSVIVKNENDQTLGTFEYVVPVLREKDPLEYTFDIKLDPKEVELIKENSSGAIPDDERPVGIDEELEEEVVVEKKSVPVSNFTTQKQTSAAKPTQNQNTTTEKTTVVTESKVKAAQQHFKMDDVETGCKRILHHVYFNFNDATLLESSYDELDKLACLLNSNSSVKVEISGHTDAIGNDQYNKVLSQKRAEAVVAYLVRQGIPKNRLSAVGYGKEQPIASNDDEEEGRSLNRRTEFKIFK